MNSILTDVNRHIGRTPGNLCSPQEYKGLLGHRPQVRKAGGYSSWASADSQYKSVSGATIKSYSDWEQLRCAWHARCDDGDHSHPADPALAGPTLPQMSRISQAAQPGPSSTFHAVLSLSDSPPLRTFIINSRSPSPVSCVQQSDDPPPYVPPMPGSLSHPADSPDTVYAVRVGRQGEIFNSAAEARARFYALQQRGTIAGFLVSRSVDDCVAWINGTPSDSEVRDAQNVQWADDDEDVPDSSLDSVEEVE
ncbi:hypothetical protein B0H13DRAFT_1857289 [Mycena leptocephala]|nr:hypothetical protein B0H13DRAFT_1857289 [Mycena leptocephala]